MQVCSYQTKKIGNCCTASFFGLSSEGLGLHKLNYSRNRNQNVSVSSFLACEPQQTSNDARDEGNYQLTHPFSKATFSNSKQIAYGKLSPSLLESMFTLTI